MLSSFLVAGLLALRSSAFLVVPLETHDINPVEAEDARRITVDLECPGCPFPTDDEAHMKTGVDSTLSLNFSTSGGKVLMNDNQVFPPPRGFSSPKTVLSRKSDGVKSAPAPMGFVFEVANPDVRPEEAGEQLLTFHVTITDVAGYPVPVDAVHLPTIQAADGTLFLVKNKVETTPTPKFCWRRCQGKPGCLKRLLVQRIRAALLAAKARASGIADKLNFKGCVDKLRGGRPGHRHGHHKHPGHHKHHGHHGHHGRFGHAVAHAIRSLIVPAVLGLSAGITACALGIVIGHGIAGLWLSIRRRSTPRLPDQETGDAEEKEGLMPVDEDLPPRYEDGEEGHIALPVEKE